MVDGLFHPLSLFVLALGSGFLLPLFGRLGPLVFVLTLAGMTVIAGGALLEVLQGAASIEIETAGIRPPFAINLRCGPLEAGVIFAVLLAAFMGALHLLPRLRERTGSMILYIILVMGVSGMIMTRDLFNLFIFIEITSIATYALVGDRATPQGLAAGFKYIVVTSLSSVFFLLGTIFIYYLTNTLNIDDMLAMPERFRNPLGHIALLLLAVSLLIELKPYPANGWGLDVYETAPAGIAALLSVVASAGLFFALFKLLPMFADFASAIALSAGLTFIVSNAIGLQQVQAQRLLGYSSIGQMALLLLALILLIQYQHQEVIILVVGGLFLNHLLAKAGLFWLSGLVQRQAVTDWRLPAGQKLLAAAFLAQLAALVGLPPFPGFWAKWELIMRLSDAHAYGWIALILLGSLLEAAYLFRWYGVTLDSAATDSTPAMPTAVEQTPVVLSAALLTLAGAGMGLWMGINPLLLWPLAGMALMFMLDRLPALLKIEIALVVSGVGGYLLTADLQGLPLLFAGLLVGGSLLLMVAGFYRVDERAGFYPLLTLLVLSLAGLVSSTSSLEFFWAWELMTFSSYLLLTLSPQTRPALLTYLLFSLGSAFLILAGFGLVHAATGSIALHALTQAGAASAWACGLLTAGFLIKLGALGVHIWLPGAYADSEDDFSALLSAVVSKASVFGLLLVVGLLGVQARLVAEPALVLAWIGILTATWGALMAVFQEDIKKLLAYSSMGQLGYVMIGIALMSHLGWVTAIYLAINHLLYKGLLFLAVVGLLHRLGVRMMYQMGGLIKNMPFSFFSVMIGIIAVSGVPPLTGFGGKWMLFNALMDKGWHWIAALAFFSSAIAFLYLYRIIHTVFLGQRKLEHRDIQEAPWVVLLPQFVLIGVIFALSVYPQWLLQPLSQAVAAYVPGQLEWDGWALVTHWGSWNAPLIMIIIGAVWAVPLIGLLLFSTYINIQKVEQFNIVYAAERPDRPETTHYAYDFFAHYERALGFLVQPRATAFWMGASEWAHSLASGLRVVYTGNGQTYIMFALLYFVGLYAVTGGF